MATRTLNSARNYYLQQRRLNAFALRAGRRARTVQQAAEATTRYQVAAATLAATTVANQASEQGLPPEPVAPTNPAAWAGFTAAGAALLDYLSMASTPDELALMVLQQIRDTASSAHGVATVATPSLAGHVRYLNPPSCARCTVLAGRWYRYSEGFERHENCDCVMVAVGDDPDPRLISNPDQAWRDGQITDLTQAEQQALEDGADMGQVVNIRRQGAGLKVAGRVLERGGRLTPEGIYQLASDRTQALELLQRQGYLR